MLTKKVVQEVMARLYEEYPDAHCELFHGSSFELLVATILSAQTTDKKVNEVTEVLFKKYNSPSDFSALSYEELQEEIRQIGLYKNKAKNIIEMSRMLLAVHNGIVPRGKEDLMKLPGVGGKTANVVMSNAFGIPAIAVDTHVFRVTNRIGIVKAKTVEKTEEQLMKKLPKDQWIQAHHTLIFHGRRTCDAKKPRCEICCIRDQCERVNV